MARIIAASIDLSKIDRTRIIEGKNGAKYYNITVVVNDDKNQYDQDVAITQGQTKEEREAKASKVYLGNGKTVWTNNAQPSASNESAGGDDLPFE